MFSRLCSIIQQGIVRKCSTFVSFLRRGNASVEADDEIESEEDVEEENDEEQENDEERDNDEEREAEQEQQEVWTNTVPEWNLEIIMIMITYKPEL